MSNEYVLLIQAIMIESSSRALISDRLCGNIGGAIETN